MIELRSMAVVDSQIRQHLITRDIERLNMELNGIDIEINNLLDRKHCVQKEIDDLEMQSRHLT